MKFSNDIIGKVIAQYLGATVDVSNTEWYKEERRLRGRFIEATLAGLNLHDDSLRACISHNIKTQSNGMQWLDFSAFKLILKSLSSLTKEDAIILNSMSNGNSEFRISYFEGEGIIDKETILDWTSLNFNQYQYLISQFYDVPHRLLKVGGRTATDLQDGKTLFEAGLALRPLSELTHEHVLEIAEHLGYNELSPNMNKEFLFKESRTLGNIEEEISKRGYEIQSLHKLKKQTA